MNNLDNSIRSPHTAAREIKGLRRLIQQTHSRMDDASLDFATGASILTRAYNSLSRLLATDHHISPPRSEADWLKDEFVQALIEMRKQRELDEANGTLDNDGEDYDELILPRYD